MASLLSELVDYELDAVQAQEPHNERRSVLGVAVLHSEEVNDDWRKVISRQSTGQKRSHRGEPILMAVAFDREERTSEASHKKPDIDSEVS